MNSEYLHPFISNNDAVELIKHKIKTNTPFAFTRFGDGEIYLINNGGNKIFLKKVCDQWGYNYPDEIETLYYETNQILKKAFVKSDLIGLLDEKCDIINMDYNPHKWSIKKEFIKSWGINPNDLQICDHMLSRQKILGSVEGFKDVIQGNSLNIISPNIKEIKEKNLSKLFDVDVTYTENPITINFKNRDEVLKSFEKIKSPVVVLGVSLLKDYGVILRDEFGKIALDMGATIDAWSGIKSRSWFNQGGKQDYLLIK
jgi:RNAse (barnase) inhibitor barstar